MTDGDLGPCRCGADQWQPRCVVCERTHCAACGHPRWYRTDRFEPLGCGCVAHVQRTVSRYGRDWQVTYWHRGIVSRCAQHAAEIAARVEAERERGRAFAAAAPHRDAAEYGEWLRVTSEDARRRHVRNGD